MEWQRLWLLSLSVLLDDNLEEIFQVIITKNSDPSKLLSSCMSHVFEEWLQVNVISLLGG